MGDVGAPAAPHQAFEVLAGVGLCCLLGALLLCNVTSAALMAARCAYGRGRGRGSRAVAALAEVFVVSVGYLVYFALLALVWYLLLHRSRKREARTLVIRGGGDPTRPAVPVRRSLVERIRARRRQDELYGPVTGRVYFLSCALMVVGFLMLMLAPAKSYAKRVGYMVAEIGWFLHSVVFCFIVCAALSVQFRYTYAKLMED